MTDGRAAVPKERIVATVAWISAKTIYTSSLGMIDVPCSFDGRIHVLVRRLILRKMRPHAEPYNEIEAPIMKVSSRNMSRT